MIHFIRRFFNDLVRASCYFIQGFKSKDWDYTYLLEDISFKLKRMRKYESDFKYHDDVTKASRLVIYDKLLGRLKDEFEDKWYDEASDMVEDLIFEPIEDQKGYYEMKTIYKEGCTAEQVSNIRKIAAVKKEQNLRRFFKYLQRNIRNMWC